MKQSRSPQYSPETIEMMKAVTRVGQTAVRMSRNQMSVLTSSGYSLKQKTVAYRRMSQILNATAKSLNQVVDVPEPTRIKAARRLRTASFKRSVDRAMKYNSPNVVAAKLRWPNFVGNLGGTARIMKQVVHDYDQMINQIFGLQSQFDKVNQRILVSMAKDKNVFANPDDIDRIQEVGEICAHAFSDIKDALVDARGRLADTGQQVERVAQSAEDRDLSSDEQQELASTVEDMGFTFEDLETENY